MKYDVLYNFISPITGRILSDQNYVMVGDRREAAMPSPILIDIRLDLINLRHDYNILKDASFIVGFPNSQLPHAQVLSSLADGIMSNAGGIVSITSVISLTGLPDLTYKMILVGDDHNRPVESDVLQSIFDKFVEVDNEFKVVFDLIASFNIAIVIPLIIPVIDRK